jgi:hypothetical protein
VLHGPDVNGTGINYPPYPIPTTIDTDYYPLIQPWSAARIFNRTLAKQNPLGLPWVMKLTTCSNSTLSSSLVFTRYDWSTVLIGGMNFSKGRISLNASAGYDGFMNITIPRNWLDGIFNVSVDGIYLSSVSWAKTENTTFSSVYFAFVQGIHAIGVEGLAAGNISGDLNGDGKVSLADLVILANNYGSSEYP